MSQTSDPYAGNGREDIVDGPLLPDEPYHAGFASFAQPSGLRPTASRCSSPTAKEAQSAPCRSTARRRKSTTVLGTSELPGGRLFTFGDVDGPKETAQLQHCLAVAYHQGMIYVADTYNNKIKAVDAKTGDTETIAGSGEAKLSDDKPAFDQPAGLSVAAASSTSPIPTTTRSG